jgi:hypothetical protein
LTNSGKLVQREAPDTTFLIDMAQNDNSGATERLLGDADIGRRLEEGLSEEHDFQSLLAARPKQVVKWLQDNGMQKLGEFETEVRLLVLRSQFTLCHATYLGNWVSALAAMHVLCCPTLNPEADHAGWLRSEVSDCGLHDCRTLSSMGLSHQKQGC